MRHFTKVGLARVLFRVTILGSLLLASWLVWVCRFEALYAISAFRVAHSDNPDARAAELRKLESLTQGSRWAPFRMHSEAGLVAPLIKVLTTDDNAGNRELAALVLTHLGPSAHPSANQLCESLRSDTSLEVRQQVATAIHSIFGTGITPEYSSDIVAALLDGLHHDTDAVVRKECAEALGGILSLPINAVLSKVAVHELLKCLTSDSDGRVRGHAARAIGLIKPTEPTARAALIRAIETDPSPIARGLSIDGLAEMAGEDVYTWQVITRVLENDSTAAVRQDAARVLVVYRPAGWIDNLIATLTRDLDEGTRYFAARDLGGVKPRPHAISIALERAGDTDASPRVRALARNILRGVPDDENSGSSP